MELLILLFIFFLVASIANAKTTQQPSAKDFVYVPKTCPPHKWQWHEIKDQDGKTVQWKLACDICGPIKPSDGPARLG